MSKLISDYAQVKISNKVKEFSRCIRVVAGNLNFTIKTRIHQNVIIEPAKHEPTPSLTGLEPLPIIGCFA